MTIRAKLIAGTLTLTVTALVVGALVLHNAASTALERQALESLQSTEHAVAARVEGSLRQNRERFLLIASRTKLRASLYAYLQNGDEAARENIEPILVDAKRSIPEIGFIAVASLTGDLVSSTGELPHPLAPPTESQLGPDSPVTITPYLGADNAVQLRLSGPLVLHGRPIGVLVVDASAIVLDRAVHDHTGLGSTGETLITARGPGERALFVTPPRLLPTAALTALPNGSKQSRLPAVKVLEPGASFLGPAVDYRGEPVFAVGRHMASVPWGLVVKQDEAEIYGPVAAHTGTVTLVTLLTCALTSALVLVLVLPLTRRVTSLTRSAELVSEGQFDHRADAHGRDEISTLARTFNAMSETIADHMSELERHNVALEQKNQELERFSYSVSHDLKSPLVTISGFVELVAEDLEQGDSDRARRDLERIGTAAGKMSAVLDSLLQLSRVGKLANPSVDSPWSDLVREALNRLEGELDAHEITVHVAEDLGSVHADPERMIEVLQNVIGNAIKFRSPERPPSIAIAAEQRDRERVLTITDNGVGIAPEYRDKVFEVFERLDARIPGTGLGLAMVRRILEHYDGRVWVEAPADGVGTRLCLTIP